MIDRSIKIEETEREMNDCGLDVSKHKQSMTDLTHIIDEHVHYEQDKWTRA